MDSVSKLQQQNKNTDSERNRIKVFSALLSQMQEGNPDRCQDAAGFCSTGNGAQIRISMIS